jgi:hypothetical protein
MSTLSLQKTEAESWKLENPQNNPAVTDLEQKIRELNEELLSKFFVIGVLWVDGTQVIQQKNLTMQDLQYKLSRTEIDLKSNILQNFSFTNLDNLLKNMHLFDDKLAEEKNRKSMAQKEQMFKSVMGGGGLDMLFSSAVATEVRKEELPKELQGFVDTISKRVVDCKS